MQHADIIATLVADPDAPAFTSDDALIAWIGETLAGGGDRDPDRIMRAICPALGRHLGVSRVGYGEVDGDAGRISVPWDYADGVASVAGTYPLRDDDWHIIEYSKGVTVAYPDWEPLPLSVRERDEMARSGSRAVLCVPTVTGGRLTGMFSVMDHIVRPWTTSEIALVERIARMVGATMDHAHALRRLRASEEMFRTLADNMPGICWLADTSGQTFWMNRTGTAFYGVDSVATDNTVTLLHPDDQVAAVRQWTEALASGQPVEGTYRIRTPDGQYRPLLGRAHPIRGDDGTILRWVGLQIDLTQERLRLRGETLLRELSVATRETDDAEAILETTCRMLGEHLATGRVSFDRADAEDIGLFHILSQWSSDDPADRRQSYRLDGGFAGVVERYGRGEAVVVPSMAAIGPDLTDAMDAVSTRRIRAGVGVPLVRDGRLAAVLTISHPAARQWSDDEVELIRQVADRTWATLGRAQAERALKQRERMQAILLGWSDAVRTETSPRAILRVTLETIGRELGVVRVNFAEADDSGEALVVEQEWVDGAPSVAGQRFPLSALGEHVVAEHVFGRPFRTDDAHADARFDPATMATYDAVGARAFVSIPLVRGDALIAVLSAQSDRPRAWDDAEVALLSELADRTWAILERARSEERLAESEALLVAYMVNAPVAMYLKDADGRYIRVNDEMAEVLGTTPDQAIGRTAFDLVPPDIAERVTELDRAALAGGVRTGVLDFGDRDRYRTLSSTRFPIPSRDGATTKLGGFTLDLTDQMRAEAELQRSRDALFQSEKLNALGSLLAGVSHELNNPLSIVVAQSVMLERQGAGGPLAERARKIRNAADRCARIVQTFLAMARQRTPERKPVELNAVVTAALELAGYGLKTDGIEVAVALTPDLPRIAADADQLHQVIINLVLNAQQAMAASAAGQRRLTVLTGGGDMPGTVAVDIIDTGPGVSMDIARRIFEPFFTTKAQGEGTGVGLSFSQGLVEAHGGRLDLVDAPGIRGAHFRLTLPIRAGVGLDPTSDAVTEQRRGRGRRALVIDDETEIAASLADFLALEGYRCDVVHSGAAAIAKLGEGGRYDLIVSDLRMPDIDGPGVHAWILANRPDLANRTAFVTGDTLGAGVARFIADSARPVLEKPFMPDGVRRLLMRLEG